MFDQTTVRLENVHHVPELEGLISLSELNSDGYNLIKEGGVLNVTKGTHVIT